MSEFTDIVAAIIAALSYLFSVNLFCCRLVSLHKHEKKDTSEEVQD